MSRRDIYEKIWQEDGSTKQRSRIEEDGPFPNSSSESQEYHLKGVYTPSAASVSWVIRARDFELLIGDEDERSEEQGIPAD
jgi:hypothetical protein